MGSEAIFLIADEIIMRFTQIQSVTFKLGMIERTCKFNVRLSCKVTKHLQR